MLLFRVLLRWRSQAQMSKMMRGDEEGGSDGAEPSRLDICSPQPAAGSLSRSISPIDANVCDTGGAGGRSPTIGTGSISDNDDDDDDDDDDDEDDEDGADSQQQQQQQQQREPMPAHVQRSLCQRSVCALSDDDEEGDIGTRAAPVRRVAPKKPRARGSRKRKAGAGADAAAAAEGAKEDASARRERLLLERQAEYFQRLQSKRVGVAPRRRDESKAAARREGDDCGEQRGAASRLEYQNYCAVMAGQQLDPVSLPVFVQRIRPQLKVRGAAPSRFCHHRPRSPSLPPPLPSPRCRRTAACSTSDLSDAETVLGLPSIGSFVVKICYGYA